MYILQHGEGFVINQNMEKVFVQGFGTAGCFVRLPSAERPSFGTPQKKAKTLPLKRRDGSVEVLYYTNLLALTTDGVKAQILLKLSRPSQPPLTSLLRRGWLTSHIGLGA